MEASIILQVFLFGLALSMDAFAIAITDGLVYQDMNKRRGFFIAGVFGFMQALMPLIGYWIVAAVELAVKQYAEKAIEITCTVVSWVAFALLLIVGLKMGFDGIRAVTHPEKRKPKHFTVKEVLFFGLLTSIDALAVGFALHGHNISTDQTIWLHVAIVLVCTFIISCLGVFLGNFFNRLFKGKYEISQIIGGVILIGLAIWVVASHYIGL
ncbi:MAG: manganese efflux pump MntP family protein [Bacilli bacterium]|nr:manganese efflux pump MntP family protein [Bacilli bacterium]